MKKLGLLILILILILSFKLNTDQMVTSSTYDKMLSVILSHDVPEVSVADFLLSENVILVDAREKNEYTISHLPRALWVGYNDFDIERLSEISKNKKIVVYCSIGYRSEKIARKLITLGYSDVSNLYGGIFEWVNQDKPVKAGLEPTQKVHGYNRLWSTWLKKGEKVY